MKDQCLLVVSAHAADFVWRSGGLIAKYVAAGAQVHVVVTSLGVRGESNDLWKKENQTAESVAATRQGESRNAAAILGVTNIEYWNYEDYPITFDAERVERLVEKIRSVKPDFVVTHDKTDLFNPDHNVVSMAVHSACVQAVSAGVRIPGLPHVKQMDIFGFEPHQTEVSHFSPDVLIDITANYEQKIAAMQCFQAQKHLIEYYTQRAFMRGNHARRTSGEMQYKYAESFSRFFPHVCEQLS